MIKGVSIISKILLFNDDEYHIYSVLLFILIIIKVR